MLHLHSYTFTNRALAHHLEMRPMTSPPLLSPSPCPLLRFLRLYPAPRRRNPTAAAPLPPYTFRRRPLPFLPAAMSSSASTTFPDSVVADPSALARKVAAIRAAGTAKLQVGTRFMLDTFWRVRRGFLTGCAGNRRLRRNAHAVLVRRRPRAEYVFASFA